MPNTPAQTPTDALQDVFADALLVCSFFSAPPVAARALCAWILRHYGLVLDDVEDDDLIARAERHLAEAARLLAEDRERWQRILPASVVVDVDKRTE